MQSSLATQLAGIRANNNATILDKSKRKKIHSVSLVYDPKEAASQDFETIYYDCHEAFRELVSVDRRFESFASSLFSETSIRFDRMLQTGEHVTALNAAIEQFLMLVASYFHLSPAFRALEWLVRRFQIQIHNTESLLLAALPYHDSEQFVRILDIVNAHHLPKPLQFLTTCKSSMQGPSRAALVRLSVRDPVLFELINEFELATIKRGLSYDRQLVFWSGLNILVTMAHKEAGESVAAADKELPLVSEVVVEQRNAPAQIAAYMILSVLATQFELSNDVLEAAIDSVVLNWSSASASRGLTCLAQLVHAQRDSGSGVAVFAELVWTALVGTFGTVEILCSEISKQQQNHTKRLAQRVAMSTLRYSPAEFGAVIPILASTGVDDGVMNAIVEFILTERPSEPELTAKFVEFIELVAARLSTSRLDQLEVALQSSIRRPSANMNGNANNDNSDRNRTENNTDDDHDDDNNDDKTLNSLKFAGSAAGIGGAEAEKKRIIEEASNTEQSTARTFLETPLSTQDKRAQIWSRGAGLGLFNINELRQLARVSPEAQLSFVLAIAIGPWPTLSRCMAIRVAHAMVASVLDPQQGGNPSSADFQAMLPLILFLLSDPERRVRREASRLMQSVALAKPPAKSPARWNDTLPGLVFLSRNDLQYVVSRLVETLEECVMDPEYVFVAARKAGKAAWCEVLVSHALHTRLPQVLWVTLRSLASFKGVSKQLAPLLADWNRKSTQDLWTQLCKEAKFPLSGIERALVGALRSNDNGAITFLLDVMRNGASPTIAELAGEHIARIWTEVLRPEAQDRVADALVDMSVDDSVAYDPQPVLTKLQPMLSTTLYTRLLSRAATTAANSLANSHGGSHSGSPAANAVNGNEDVGSSAAATPPLFNEASKRRRRRSSSFVQLRDGPREQVVAEAERHLRRTTTVLELLERSAPHLSQTPPLISVLFDILEELMAMGEGSRLPVLYTEELLANCMISLVESLKSQGVKSRELSSLKINAVVSCIRSSPSPQVQNRLLLLIAALATLCPDIVLHGVMPIFTFMGANTVRLDNDYSAHVIEQTIEQVIPALVAAGDKHEEIEMALMSFVAAFPHVPRHRRNTLFGALIKTLGPEQSLYKLLLLLGQRYADVVVLRRPNSTSRSLSASAADAKAIVHFATPFLRSFPPGVQISAMSSYVRFVVAQNNTADNDNDKDDSRFGLLKIREALKESTSSPRLRNALFDFLARTAGEPEVIAGTQPLRVQVGPHGEALTPEEWQLASSMIDALLNEVTAAAAAAASPTSTSNHSNSSNGGAAEDLLMKCLDMLSIDRFVATTKPLITPQSERLLTLISSKFRYESVDDDDAVQAGADIVTELTEWISKSPSSALIDAAEAVLARFGTKLRAQELTLLDVLVGASGLLNPDLDVVLSAILAINTVCQHLGAAVYGFFPRIFPVLCEKVQRAQDQDQLRRREELMEVDNDGNSNNHAETMSTAITGAGSDNDDDDEDDDDEEDDDIQLAVFALFAGLIRQMPRFMAPETPAILNLVLASQISMSSRQQILKVLDDKIEPRTLLSALTRALPAALRGGIRGVTMFFRALARSIEKVSKRDLASEMPAITSLLLSSFAVRQSVADSNFVNQVEAKSIDCGIAAVLRLNDRVFRPQFKRIVSWGFEAGAVAREIAVLKFVNRVLSQLKGVVTNYFGYLLDSACAVLEQGNAADATVRKLVLQALITSFTFDQDDFWQSPSRFDRISDALIGQLVTEPMTHGPLVVKAITALALASSTQHRKRINDALSNLIAAAAPVTQKIWTIKVFSSLYRRLGEDWMANLPQLVPLIAELLDDEDESVELETRKSLVPVIENVLGESLDRYLA